ncbi:16S rRNA (guanine(527)-N(7))-methyltransferase RsmG [Acidihalobacter prosperus]|uniref:Ribosomal RNA small subunit methyltransferase G n=1 Tax=Acidihalobacter prosperus TaxID=160660 RepID=A0A1A6C4S9_9GAMM|nr:16S rRNA (guanine(527)-N(7))-methyltransferase RsmG [Acidihalobacter prosperus]OBS09567.1 16S rRNA methyltransferase G [Acidihalobacter prosperus]
MDGVVVARLEAGLEALGLDRDPERIQAQQHYLELMVRWNRVHNLTAIQGDRELVSHHLLDSLSIHRFLHGDRVLDVGSGAGLPGIPLAIYHPARHFTLLDASAKRVRFLRQCALELGLDNVVAVHARIERYTPVEGFATVVSRAFATLADFTLAVRHAVSPGGHMLAMKGRYPAAELDALPTGVRVHAVHELQVPGLDARRHLADLGWEANDHN